MRQSERKSELGWQDVILIFAIVTILVVVLLFQIAQRTDALPLKMAAYWPHIGTLAVLADVKP